MLISFFVLCITLIPLADGLKIKNYKFGDEKTIRDRAILIFKNTFTKSFLILIFSALIFVTTREKEQFLAYKADKELTRRDSIREHNDHLRTLNITKALNEAGYTISSLTGKVEKLEYKVTRPTQQPTPDVMFEIIKKSFNKDTLFLAFKFTSNEARSKLTLSFSHAHKTNNKYEILGRNTQLIKTLDLPKGMPKFIDASIYIHPFQAQLITFHLKGFFIGDNKQVNKIDEYLVYDILRNTSGYATSPIADELDKVFKP